MVPPWLAIGLGYVLGVIILAIIVGTYLQWISRKYPRPPEREPEE